MAVRFTILTFALLTGLAFGQRVTTRAVPIHTVQAQYTEEARSAKIEGTVMVQVVIDEAGIPQDPKVKQGLDKGLDEKAIEAVRLWRFKPALSFGHPVSAPVTIQIVFKLPK